MDPSERAARTMLGSMDKPDLPMGALLEDLFRRQEMLSDGEQIVLDLGLQFYNGGGTATLANALRWLDRDNLVAMVESLGILRPDVVAEAARRVP